MQNTSITTDRFLLRLLEVSDATDRYLGWLSDRLVSRFIVASEHTRELKDLESYISEKRSKDDTLFWGIFTKDKGEHIGNIKYEPIDTKNRLATMGILIGDSTWHNKGVAKEVISATANWLTSNLGIRLVKLRVEIENAPALAAYKKLGFVEDTSVDYGARSLALKLEL